MKLLCILLAYLVMGIVFYLAMMILSGIKLGCRHLDDADQLDKAIDEVESEALYQCEFISKGEMVLSLVKILLLWPLSVPELAVFIEELIESRM